jgi:hypothetical protein
MFGLGGAVFLPGAYDRFDLPKLAWCAAAIAVAMWAPPRGRLPRLVSAAVAVGVALLSVHALSSDAALTRLIGRAPRYEGLLGLSVYIGAAAAGARLLGPDRARGSTTWLLDFVAIAAIAIAIEAVLETAGLYPLQSNVARPGSLLGNASEQGAWGVLALGPLAALAVWRRRPLHVAGAIAATTTIDCSLSRGAYIGAAITVAILLPLLPGHRQRVALLVCSAIAAVAVFTLPTSRARVTGTSPLASETVSGRGLLWGETLHVIASEPLVGVGVGGFVDALPRHQTLRYEREIGPQTLPDSPENWLLQAAVDGGLPLLAISVALAAATIARGLRATLAEPEQADRAALAGMVAGVAGYGVALLFYFTSSGATPLAMLFAGALLAERLPTGAALTSRIKRTRVAAAVGFGVLTVVLVPAALAEIPLRSAILSSSRGAVATADANFRAARTLRPWDAAIDEDASHAFAELASSNVAGAATAGVPWASRSLSATPDSVQAIADAATIDLGTGRAVTAATLLDHALALDPLDGDLRIAAAGAALVLGRRDQAIALAEQARADNPADPRIAQLIALARRR